MDKFSPASTRLAQENEMAYFAVSLQLNTAKDYAALWQAFTQLSALRAMDNLYLVDLDGAAPDRLCSYLCQFVEEEDFLFVVPFQARPSKQSCYRGTGAWLDERFSTEP